MTSSMGLTQPVQGPGDVPHWMMSLLEYSMAVLQTGRLLLGYSQASHRQLTVAISEDVLEGEPLWCICLKPTPLCMLHYSWCWCALELRLQCAAKSGNTLPLAVEAIQCGESLPSWPDINAAIGT